MDLYNHISTDYDVMKEFLIEGAPLVGRYGFPRIPPAAPFSGKTIDFEGSFSKRIKNHRELNVNFYIGDYKFLRVWNNPGRYVGHLRCFHSICGLDFSIDTRTPMALQIYNHYRNLALDCWLTKHGIQVIPSVPLLPTEGGREWIFDGLPKNSMLSCTTNGRVKAKAARLEFCECWKRMEEWLEPVAVMVVGRMVDELRPNVKIINREARNQKMDKPIR